jgi:hypothetical protein
LGRRQNQGDSGPKAHATAIRKVEPRIDENAERILRELLAREPDGMAGYLIIIYRVGALD